MSAGYGMNPYAQSGSANPHPASILLGELAKLPAPEPLRKDIVAAPIEAVRIWAVQRPKSLEFDKQRVEEMAAAFDAGRNPFVGLFGARLYGVGVSQRWDKPTLEAGCTHAVSHLAYAQVRYAPSMHEAPARGCSCGIWALKDDAAVHQTLAEYAVAGGKGFAYGRVQLWGRIYEHARGYRAQFARPLEVTVIGGDDETVLELASFYGCPVKRGPLPEAVVKLHAEAVEKKKAAVKQQAPGSTYLSTSYWMQQVTSAMSYAPSEPEPPEKKRRWWQV